MSVMFGGCSSVNSLNLSNFNTNRVKNMCGMFNGCCKLNSLNLSNFNTNNAIYIAGMFYGCSSLTYLDINNFNCDNINTADKMANMFKDCNLLKIEYVKYKDIKIKNKLLLYLN